MLGAIAVLALSGLIATGTTPHATIARGTPATHLGRDDTDEHELAPPPINARAYLVYDAQDDTLLAEDHSDTSLPIASLTKLMTALVIVDRTQGNEKVTVSKYAVRAEVADPDLGLKAGEKLSVDDLLAALLVHSSNDAAIALAEHVGGTEDDFIELMNDRAKRLKMSGTTFASVNGLDEEGNVSTAADMLLLTRTALKDVRIQRLVATRKVDIEHQDGAVTTLTNRNRLLTRYDGVDGVKTGHTNLAGYCLISHFADDDGSDIFTVVLGTIGEDARDSETVKLLDWARKLRPSVTIAEAGTPIGSAPIAFTGHAVGLYLSEDVKAHVRIGSTLTERIVVPRLIEAPQHAGDEVGRYEILVGGKRIAQTRIYIDRDVRPRSLIDKVRMVAGQWRPAAHEGWRETARSVHRFRNYWGL